MSRIFNSFVQKTSIINFKNITTIKLVVTDIIRRNIMSSLKIAGNSIPVTSKDQTINIESVLEFQPFKDWATTLSKEILATEKRQLEINGIEIQNVDYFGKKIGFVKFKVDIKYLENGTSKPTIVFMVGINLIISVVVTSLSLSLLNTFI